MCTQDCQRLSECRLVRRLQSACIPQQISSRRLRGRGTSTCRHQALRIPARRDIQRNPGPDGAGEGPAKRPRSSPRQHPAAHQSNLSSSPGAITPRATSTTRRCSRVCGRLLQVQLQIAQVEAELAKALAALERAVGSQINEHPPRSNRPSRPFLGSMTSNDSHRHARDW